MRIFAITYIIKTSTQMKANLLTFILFAHAFSLNATAMSQEIDSAYCKAPSAYTEQSEKDTYTLVHRIIPTFVKMYSEKTVPMDIFLALDLWPAICTDEGRLGFTYDWDNLKVESTLIEDYPLLFYTFPTPRRITEPLYAIVILLPDGQARYFPLEKSFGNEFLLCEWSAKGHSNYGELSNPSRQSMIDHVMEIVKKTK